MEGYGRELFTSFVPSSARARMDRTGKRAALLSGALVALHKPGDVVEVGWRTGAALAGVLRAARHKDAIVAVSVPFEVRSASPQAPAQIIEEILAAAQLALFDRPLVVVARAQPLPAGASVDRLSEGLYRDVEAGYTSIAFSPAAFQGDVDAFLRVTAPLVEQDLGLEVELDGTTDPALILARLDDAGLSLSAVRGAHIDDEIGGAFLVCDLDARPTVTPRAAGTAASGLRIVLDSRLDKAAARVPAGDVERAEASAWLETSNTLDTIPSTRGAGGRLLDALAQSLQK